LGLLNCPLLFLQVVGVKDNDVSKIIEESGRVVTVTVIPNFLFQHIVKK